MQTLTGVGSESEAEVPEVDARGLRSWSSEQRQRIVVEALAPHASVAEVARRHGLNANLIFKWLKCAREGWPDRRRAFAVVSKPMTFVPVEVIGETVGKEETAPPRALTIDHVVPPRTQSLATRSDILIESDSKAVCITSVWRTRHVP